MTTPSNSACCGGAAYPRQWKLYVSNNGDGECTDCELFDGEYVVNLQGGIECAHFDGSTGAFCNWSEAWLHFYVSAYGDGTYEFQLELQAPEHEPDQWVCWKTDQPVDAAKRWTLGTLIEDNDYCNWGSATIEAEPVDMEFPVTPDDVCCLCNMRKGAPKCWPCEPAPYPGWPEGCGCQPKGSQPLFSLADCCACEIGCPCQSSENACVSCKDRSAAAPRLGHPFLDRAMDLVSKLRYSLEGRPEWWPPAPLVNPSNGNVVLQIWPPLGGPADPRVVLTYNSWSPEESEYGYGWSNSLNRWVAGGNIYAAQQKRHVSAQVKYPTSWKEEGRGMFFFPSSRFKEGRLARMSGRAKACKLRGLAGMKRS